MDKITFIYSNLEKNNILLHNENFKMIIYKNLNIKVQLKSLELKFQIANSKEELSNLLYNYKFYFKDFRTLKIELF